MINRLLRVVNESANKSSDERVLGVCLGVAGFGIAAGAFALDALIGGHEIATTMAEVAGVGVVAVGSAVLAADKLMS